MGKEPVALGPLERDMTTYIPIHQGGGERRRRIGSHPCHSHLYSLEFRNLLQQQPITASPSRAWLVGSVAAACPHSVPGLVTWLLAAGNSSHPTQMISMFPLEKNAKLLSVVLPAQNRQGSSQASRLHFALCSRLAAETIFLSQWMLSLLLIHPVGLLFPHK